MLKTVLCQRKFLLYRLARALVQYNILRTSNLISTLFVLLFLHPPPVEPPPNGLEYYIHRTGRTGRKGQPGLAILVYSGGENVHGIDAGDLLRQVGVVSCTEPPTLSLPILTYTAIVLGLCPRTRVSLLP